MVPIVLARVQAQLTAKISEPAPSRLLAEILSLLGTSGATCQILSP